MRLIALALLAVLPDAQEAAQLTGSLSPAYGRPLSGEWHPYVLEITNAKGPDTVIRARVEDEDGETAATRQEPLARGATKRLFFYLPLGAEGYYPYGNPPAATVTDTRGQTLRLKPLSSSSATDPRNLQIGIFSGNAAALASFGIPDAIGMTDTTPVRLTARTLPDRWIGLACLDALVLHDAPFDELTPAQGRALAEYVRQGGTVILSPGPDAAWFKHPVLAAFVAVDVVQSGPATALPHLEKELQSPLPERTPFIFHTIGSSGRELPEFQAGHGRVFVVPFDLRRRPFEGWPGLGKLWEHLFSRIPRRNAEPDPGSNLLGPWAGVFRDMSSRINSYPPFPLLLLLATVFLALVCPVNYLVLRRLGMSLLVVLSVPAISAAFLGIVLATGYVLKGTSTVTLSFRVLSAAAGDDLARERQFFTLFSPSTRTYDVELPPSSYALPSDRLMEARPGRRYPRSSEGDPGRLELEIADRFVYRNVPIGQWQTWHLDSRSVRDLGGGVQFEEQESVVRITNQSPLTLSRGIYVTVGQGGFCFPFGEIAPGKTVDVPIRRDSWKPVSDLGFGPDSLAQNVLGPRLEGLFQSRRSRTLHQQVKFLLCVVADDAPPIGVNARASGRSESLTLLHVREEKP